MNAHDSERIKGMLEELGLGEAAAPEDADVLVFNTCTIREKPDQRFAAHIAQAAARKRAQPDTVIAVGGCYAEAQRERLFTLYPEVDVAFGPGSIPHLGEWLGAGGFGVPRSAFGIAEERRFAATLPMHRERRYSAWVQVSMGCNSKCAYCIVTSVRGRLVSELRDAIPDLALTTDIIVGFPGETDAEFEETVEVVQEVGFDGAFTFVYSPRQGTEAAASPDQVPDEVKRERIERLVDVVQWVAHERNAQRVGLVTEVLVEGPSRTDASLLRGRTRRHPTVNFH